MPYIVLTFDDFSRDIAKVMDVLKSVGIKGVFFISTASIKNYVHAKSNYVCKKANNWLLNIYLKGKEWIKV
jgi:hypothetical protein